MSSPNSRFEELLSIIRSLKEISTIIFGLALTNTIVQFLLVDGKVKDVNEITFLSVLIFALLVINNIRFFHGNFRHLDLTYSSSEKTTIGDSKLHAKGEKVSLDFFIIIGESLILSAISFYQIRPLYFFYLMTLLLIVDVIWFLGTYQYTLDKKIFNHQRIWAMNNVIVIFLMLAIYSFSTSIDQEILPYIFSIILAINTIVDYRVNWNFYFPIPISEKQNGE